MALFQRKPQTSSSAPLYTLGLNKTILIVGLGNPGKEYDGTRHNVGFMCVDALASQYEFDPWTAKKDLSGMVTSGTVGDARVLLFKPSTFMNLSGEAVQKLIHFYKISPKDTVVIHDELDVPFGQIRTRFGGSSAGHNGLKSTIQHIGPDFGRVRIGIGNADEKTDSAAFVLQKFSSNEVGHLPALIKEVISIVTEYLYSSEFSHDTRSFV